MQRFFVLLTLILFLANVDGGSSRQIQRATKNTDDVYSIHLVENLLRYPSQLGAGFAEKQINRLGDRASTAVLKIVPEEELTNPEKVRTFLPLLRAAFLDPNLITIAEDRKPKVTFFLLRHLKNEVKDAGLKKEISDAMDFVRQKTR